MNPLPLRHLPLIVLLLTGLTTHVAWSAESSMNLSSPVLQVETIPAVPRPLTEPRTGPAPIPKFGGRRDVLPDPAWASADPVSPESRAHLEALTREFRQR